MRGQTGPLGMAVTRAKAETEDLLEIRREQREERVSRAVREGLRRR